METSFPFPNHPKKSTMTSDLVKQYGDRIYSHSLEVRINLAADGKYMLPDDSILRDKVILGLFVPDNQDDTARSSRQRPLISNAAVRSAYLTLKYENDAIISEHPLSDFLASSADKAFRHFHIQHVNPSKSFVQITNPALISDGESIVIQFIYLRN